MCKSLGFVPFVIPGLGYFDSRNIRAPSHLAAQIWMDPGFIGRHSCSNLLVSLAPLDSPLFFGINSFHLVSIQRALENRSLLPVPPGLSVPFFFNTFIRFAKSRVLNWRRKDYLFLSRYISATPPASFSLTFYSRPCPDEGGREASLDAVTWQKRSGGRLETHHVS